MKSISAITRIVAALLLGPVVCMAVFGLTLALLQSLPWSGAPSYMLASAIASAAIAIASGGFTVAAVVRNTRMAAVFGLLFGTASFGYIFGPSWLVIPSVAVAVLLAAAAGRAADRLLAKRGGPAAAGAD